MKIKLKLGKKDKKEKAYFSIVWTEKGSLKYKDYPLNLYNEVFEKWYSLRGYHREPQIVIANPSGYEPIFDSSNVAGLSVKEVMYTRFIEWFVEELEIIGIKMAIPEATEEAFWKRSQEYWNKKA